MPSGARRSRRGAQANYERFQSVRAVAPGGIIRAKKKWTVGPVLTIGECPMRRFGSAWILAILASACLTPQHATQEQIDAYNTKARAAWDSASKVRVTINAEQVKGCESLGTITMPWSAEVSFVRDPDGRSKGLSDSEIYLRLETVKVGGDTALISATTAPQETRTFYLPDYPHTAYTSTGEAAHVVGEAYRCPPR